MKWFTYLQRTPLAQIRADWSEYMALWRKCAMLRGLRNAAYDKIAVCVDGYKKEDIAPACIQYAYYYANSTTNRGSNDMLENMLWMTQIPCKRFRESSNGVKCQKSDCPCLAHNHEYADACERYSLMCQARRDFWRVKFAQASQHTK